MQQGWRNTRHLHETPTTELSRVRNVKTTAQLIGQLFQGSHHAYSTDLPDDAQLVGVYYDPWDKTFTLQFWSSTFDVVPEAQVIPKMDVMFKVDNDMSCGRCGGYAVVKKCVECGWQEENFDA